MCGEKRGRHRHSDVRQGSPPRVRGKVVLGLCRSAVPGITPACAGKSPPKPGGRRCCRDHPRVCGEKANLTVRSPIGLGSPPRVRGKVLAQCKDAEMIGITPACAGKSRGYRHAGGKDWDHPRVCGEKFCLLVMLVQPEGSPPRVRGKD